MKPRLQKLRNLGHDVREEGSRLKCHRCARDVHVSNVTKWIAIGACEPWHQQRSTNTVIGKREVHPTHEIAQYRGLTWCWKCGMLASRKMQALAIACKKPEQGSRGQKNLGRLRQRLPPSGYEWPATLSAEIFPECPET